MPDSAVKVALVTGAARGIGLATAKRFLAEGWRVALLDIDAATLKAAVASLAKPDSTLMLVCDVADATRVAAAIAEIAQRFGRLDALVNNAGVAMFASVMDTSDDDWSRILAVNLTGPFLCTKAAVPLMREYGGGAIVNITSISAVRASTLRSAYGTSKAGVHGFCMTLERQLAPRGIRVNVVCPGSIDTPMKRQNVIDGALAHGQDPEAVLAAAQLGDPDGVAKVLAFLASPDADYVLGTVFTR